jgi:SAM-dependent methyltransferase
MSGSTALGVARYNERSWAIDLIGHIKHIVTSNNRSIKDAGGEQTVSVDGGSLFPDVLLFGDRSTARILQGWELKMPDTSIDDYEFRHNAEQKAKALGLDSYVLWNVSHVRLYTRSGNNDAFTCSKQWNELSDITSRASVLSNSTRWENLATEIIGYLNDLFDRGSLEGRQFIDAYKSGGVTALIMENTSEVASAIKLAATRNNTLNAEITLWWQRYKEEYGQSDKLQALAQANIANWIGKFLFAHIIREKDQRAQAVIEIGEDTTPQQALQIFQSISNECNFWSIFSDNIALGILPSQTWNQLKQFNYLLTDLRVGAIEQSQLSGVLEATVEVAIRKLRGQYPTPISLARLLVELCVKDKTTDRVLDPCCGSGTIARAALEQKLNADILPDISSSTVFAGDQDPQAIQIATFALAKPDLMHMPLRIFRADAFTLTPETVLEFRDPSTGELFSESLGKFDAIISNFPFVAQEGRKQYGNAIANVSESFDEEVGMLPKNADISAYLPFSLQPLLKINGKLGIIITNAWLSTAWGDAFFDLLNHYYNLKAVITSGAGRWFQNSTVVTNILIMEKKAANDDEQHQEINYVVLTRPLEELSDQESLEIAAAQIELGQTQDETMTIRSVSLDNIQKYRKYGLGGNAQFVNCDWILDLPLTPLKSLFSIKRGERRGWDTLFYPEKNHGIEEEYIRPVLKSPTEIKGYLTAAESDAFCCSKSIEQLSSENHTGALNWIDRFKNANNNSGKPLTESLARSGMHWYEMSGESLSTLVMPINYGNRIYISRLNPSSFVNQRLISLNPNEQVDVDLCHALLNSSIGMFIIEGMGFGRGLGALDLSKDRIEKFMHILDPEQLNSNQVQAIKDAFAPLLRRDILEVADELEQQDRQNFDDVVIHTFNLSVGRNQIYTALLGLVEIRQTATETFE